MSLLEEILSREDCENCRFCCVFDKSDVWEYPFDPNNAKYNEKGLFKCEHLSETGCDLEEDKPFDCQIWPFRTVRLRNGGFAVTVSPHCKKVFSLPLQVIYDFYNQNLHEKIRRAISSKSIKTAEYKNGYPIISLIENS